MQMHVARGTAFIMCTPAGYIRPVIRMALLMCILFRPLAAHPMLCIEEASSAGSTALDVTIAAEKAFGTDQVRP